MKEFYEVDVTEYEVPDTVYRGWLDPDRRLVYYVDHVRKHLVQGDIRQYVAFDSYEVHGVVTILASLPDPDDFREEEFREFYEKMNTMSLLEYLRVFAERDNDSNLGLERLM